VPRNAENIKCWSEFIPNDTLTEREMSMKMMDILNWKVSGMACKKLLDKPSRKWYHILSIIGTLLCFVITFMI